MSASEAQFQQAMTAMQSQIQVLDRALDARIALAESKVLRLFSFREAGAEHVKAALARHRWMQESLKFVLEKDRKNDDKWHAIRPFMHDWNKNQADNYHAGWVLCIDESISRWLGMHDLDKKANEKAAAAAAAVGDAAVAAAAAAATAAANVTDKQGAIPHPC